MNNAEQALNLLQQFQAKQSEDYELKSRIIYVQAMNNHNSNVLSDIEQLQTEPLSGLAMALLHLALAEIARREQKWETVAEHLIQAFQVSLGASFISDRLSSLPPQYRSMQRRYLLIADALCRANKDKEAWTWLQYANSQAGKELLAQSNTNAKLEAVLQAERKILSLHEQYDNIELVMTERVNNLLQLEREYEDAKRDLRKSNPAIWEEIFSERVNVHPDDLDQIRFRLPEDTILLEPAIMDSQVAIFICSRQNGVRLKTTPMQNAERRIKGLIIQYRQAMASPGDIATAQNIGKKLYDILLLPVAEDIRALNPKTILYSPAGILRYVSLATLYDGNHYLMEQYNTANLSGYDLIRLGTDEQVPASGIRFVGFANPDGTLPASDIECSEIAGLFPKSTVFSQHNATLKQFLALTGEASFVHLATHGVLNPESPEDSYLVFADDKFQYKDMIAGIPMMDKLGMLTLSACNTANVNPAVMNNNAMEIYGIAYQFVHKTHSGATLATLWPVSDSHTRQLMTTMYSQLLSNATNTGHWHRAQCLANAQRQLHATPTSEHPFFWGAFILIGNFK